MTFKEGTTIFDADGRREVVALDRRDLRGWLWAVDDSGWRRSRRRELRGAWLEVCDANADLLDFLDSVDPEAEPYQKEQRRARDRMAALRAYRRLVFAARCEGKVISWRLDLSWASGIPSRELWDELGSGDDYEVSLASLEEGAINDIPSRWPTLTIRGPKGEINIRPPTRPRTALDVLREVKPLLPAISAHSIGEAIKLVNGYLADLDREEGGDD